MKKSLACMALLLLACSGQGGGSESELPDTGPEVGTPETVSADSDSREAPALPFDWCTPDAPPDEVCFAQKRDPESDHISLALAIAQKQMAARAPEELPWNWEEAVLMLALTELHRVTGDASLQAYYRAWLDHHVDAGYLIGTSDTCAPAGVAVRLFAETGDDCYRAVVEEALTYLREEAGRTEDGGISHLGTIDLVTLWIDSLFMFGNVLVGWGEVTGEPGTLDEFGEQFRIFTAQLQQDCGFYTHAADWIMPQTPGIFWTRGNGWVAAAAGMYLRVRMVRGQSDPQVEEALDRLLAAIRETQDESGLWWSIANRPGEIYLETSGSALFAYGLARAWRLGLVGDDVLEPIARAMAGVRSRVVDGDDGPVVIGISGPTTADRFQGYADVPLEEDLTYGLGAVIYALIETSGLPLPDADGESQP